MSEPSPLSELATRWIQASDVDAHRFIESTVSDLFSPSQLLRLSQEVGDLLRSDAHSRVVLSRVDHLFDQLAENSCQPDQFGERIELLLLLSFLGWRHSARLGLAFEYLTWTRVADSLISEEFTWKECLSDTLFHDRTDETDERTVPVAASDVDLFVSIAILRAQTNTNPRNCFEAGQQLSRDLKTNSPASRRETSLFLAELMLIQANVARTLGRQTDCSTLAAASIGHFKEVGLLALNSSRVELVRAVALRNAGHQDESERRCQELIPTMKLGGLYRETLIIRLSVAACRLERGRDDSAREILEELVNETRDGDQSIYASALSNLSECLRTGGDEVGARRALEEALSVSRHAHLPMILALSCSGVGEVRLREGDWQGARKWFSISITIMQELRVMSFLAYMRVYLAEALIAGELFAEACEQLLLALPTIRLETMVPEGIRAMKLLTVIGANSKDQLLRELANEMRLGLEG